MEWSILTLPELKKPTKVSVIPLAPGLADNALFERRRRGANAQSPNEHWMDGFAELYKKALAQNIVLATDDILPIEDADIVIYMRQPNSPADVVELKKKHPHLKTIFVLFETMLGGQYTFNPRNHEGFDAIITHDDRLVDHRRYFPMRPRAYYRERIKTGLPFEQRRVGCLVGTNRKMTYRSGIFTQKKGWYFSWSDWFDYVFCPGQLITYRSEVGRLCAQYPAGTFDIFGEGWDLQAETHQACLGIPKAATIDYCGNYRYYFAFENHSGEHSVISERIWDALWGDTVPVYYGNKNLQRYIPRECFIDASSFDSPKEMLDWLVRASESEWSRYREAGREFIRGSQVEKYLPDAFAEEFLRPILALAHPAALVTEAV